MSTPLTEQQLDVLMRDLKSSRVLHRTQGGTQLSYLATYDVKAMLIRVFGFGGFSADVIDTRIVDVERTDDDKIKIAALCTVRLTIHQLDATYTESAIAGQTGRSFGDVADFAVKTAESDALKRAATYLGTQFGLSLYSDGRMSDVVVQIVAPDQTWPDVAAHDLGGVEVES